MRLLLGAPDSGSVSSHDMSTSIVSFRFCAACFGSEEVRRGVGGLMERGGLTERAGLADRGGLLERVSDIDIHHSACAGPHPNGRPSPPGAHRSRRNLVASLDVIEPLPAAAFMLGVAALFGARLLAWAEDRPRAAVAGLAATAAILSGVWIEVYLRGGPRIIDATAYYASARALAEGHVAWPVPEPAASVMGRFLVRDTLGSGGHVGVIFPPGYPALLAVGFLVGAPLLVGPLLAALLVALTFDLGRSAAHAAGLQAQAIRVGLVAAALSVTCAALRYHTADTMSHGLAAACVAAALAAALRARSEGAVRWYGAAGAAVGVLVATRPASAVALAAVVLLVVWRGASARKLAALALGALPFVAVLLGHQRLVTGAWLASCQSLYYAVSDGPAGCFRYGFGGGIGCVHEHGQFVDAHLRDGYDLVAAASTTLRRLKMHGIDPLNAEPLALLIALPAWLWAWRSAGLRGLALAPPAFVAAYAPFYFDGNYPGGGARFFADVLPVEHALVALAVGAVAVWAGRGGARAPLLRDARRLGAVVVGLSLLGFALRAHGDHAALRDREGGRPMLLATDLPRHAGGSLVFVDTDHGLLLGLDPDARADRGGVEVVRWRGDALDRWLWEARGRPHSVSHDYDVRTGRVIVAPFTPPDVPFVEAASLWPALRQARGYALPGHDAAPCGARGRVLRFVPDPAGAVDVELAAPPTLRGRRVSALFAGEDGGTIDIVGDGGLLATLRPGQVSEGCTATDAAWVPLDAAPLVLRVRGGGPLALGVIATDEAGERR